MDFGGKQVDTSIFNLVCKTDRWFLHILSGGGQFTMFGEGKCDVLERVSSTVYCTEQPFLFPCSTKYLVLTYVEYRAVYGVFQNIYLPRPHPLSP